MTRIYDPKTSQFRSSAELQLWQQSISEPVLEPGLPIIDSHHHLWIRENENYLIDDLVADMEGGHNIIATVFVEGGVNYVNDGPMALRPVGETRFAVNSAFAAPEKWQARACAGIIARADMMLGDAVVPVLEAQHDAGAGRLKGIRSLIRWDQHGVGMWGNTYGPGRCADRSFRTAFRHLHRLHLSYDAWVYHHQLDEIADLAAQFPETTIILNHVGGPLGAGPYQEKREEVFTEWKTRLKRVAEHPNVYMKVGGLGMLYYGFPFHLNAVPAGSEILARSWAPYVHECLEAFGADRCMFESNFPVDKQTTSYGVVWNTFKRMSADFSLAEKTALFSGTAARAYRLAVP